MKVALSGSDNIDGQLFVYHSNNHSVIVLDCRNRRFVGLDMRAVEVVIENSTGLLMWLQRKESYNYVSDCNNSRIQVFSMEGGFIRLFAIRDPSTQKCYAPRGICVEPDKLLCIIISCLDHDNNYYSNSNLCLHAGR